MEVMIRQRLLLEVIYNYLRLTPHCQAVYSDSMNEDGILCMIAEPCLRYYT